MNSLEELIMMIMVFFGLMFACVFIGTLFKEIGEIYQEVFGEKK